MKQSTVGEARSKRAPHRPASQSCLKVLLVDDEIDLLLPLADALRCGGLAATIATSSDEVVFEIGMSPPDVVVLDSELADRGLLAQVRALIATLPVVLMNSAGRPDVTWKAMLATIGVTCVERPIDAPMLLALLSDASRFQRAAR